MLRCNLTYPVRGVFGKKEFAHIIDINISYLLANLKFIKQNYGKLLLSKYY